MKKQFLEHRSKLKRDHGRRIIDITLDKRVMHYLFEALAKYQEFLTTKKERDDVQEIVDELVSINNSMNDPDLPESEPEPEDENEVEVEIPER